MTSPAVRLPANAMFAAPIPATTSADHRVIVHASLAPATVLEQALTWALVCLFIVMRVAPLSTFNASFDDVWSIEVARLGWRELPRFISTYDFHPPLFYLSLKLWMFLGGQSLRWLGLLPIVYSVLTLIPLLALFRELRLTAAERNLTLFLIAVNGYLIGYTQELRMYTLLLLLTVTSLLLFARLCNSRRDHDTGLTVALVAVNLAALYTQFFGALVIATEMMFLFYWDWRKALRFTGAMALVGLAFLPWAAAVVMAAAARTPSNGHIFFQIRRPDLFSLAFFYASLNGIVSLARSTTLSILLFGGPVAVWAASLAVSADRRRREGASALMWLLAFASIPVLIAFTASQLLPTAVWGQRHFIIASVAYLTLVAISTLQLRPFPIRSGVVACLVAWAGIAGWQAAHSPYKQVGLDYIAHRLSATATSTNTSARLYVSNDDDGCVLGYFLNRGGISNVDVALLQPSSEPLDHVAGANLSLMARNRLAADRDPITSASPANLPLAVIGSVADLPGVHFWIADDVDPPTAGSNEVPLRDQFRRAGYTVDEAFSTTSITRRWNVRHLAVFSVTAPPASHSGNTGVPQRRIQGLLK